MNVELIKNLGPFFRGKVVNNKDDRKEGRIGVHISDLMGSTSNQETENKNINVGMKGSTNWVVAYPTHFISKSKNDEKLYQTFAGNFDVPREGAYVLVFFLKNDPTQCFYIPNLSLPFTQQTIVGMNLPENISENFESLDKKLNIKMQEFHNGNIVGIDLNDETNECFLIFESGSSVVFGAPIEFVDENSLLTGRKSSSKKPTFLNIKLERKDGVYEMLDLRTVTFKEATYEIKTHKKSLAEQGFGNNYENSVVENSEIFASTKMISKDETSSIDHLVKHEIEDVYTTTNSSLRATAEGAESNTSLNFTNLHNGVSRSYEVSDSINSEEIILNKNFSLKEPIEDETSGELEDTTTITSERFFLEKTLEYIKKKLKSTITTTKDVFSNSINLLKIYSSRSDEKFSNVKFRIQTEDNKAGYELRLEKNFPNKEDDMSVIELKTKLEDNKGSMELSLNNDQANSHIKLSGDDINQKLVFGTNIKTPNPGDPFNILGLPPLFERGHQVSIDSTADTSSIRLESVKQSMGDKNTALPVMGGQNVIELIESGTESTLNIELKGLNPAGGMKLTVKTNAAGEMTLELPMGDINIKSGLGKVKVEAATAEVKALTNASISAAGKIDVKGGAVEIKADTMLNLKGVATEVEGAIIKHGKGASQPAILSIPLLTWLTTHVHPANAPVFMTAPPVIPPPPTMLSKKNLME